MRVEIHEVESDSGIYSVCVDDEYTDIFMQGTRNGFIETFSGEARHIRSWAKEHGFRYRVHEVDLDVQKHMIDRWYESRWEKNAKYPGGNGRIPERQR
jgi:hypothetical protein